MEAGLDLALWQRHGRCDPCEWLRPPSALVWFVFFHILFESLGLVKGVATPLPTVAL